MRFEWMLACLLLITAPVWAEVVDMPVEYRAGETVMQGYLAYDNALDGRRPGVLVVHEWWGHNDYARKRARMLAALGYTALAVDMYGDGKQADHPQDASQFSGEVTRNMEIAAARFDAAKQLLQQQPSVNPDDISAIGYCFGGGIVLEMARRGVDLDLVASFHGSLGTGDPAQPGQVKAKVLVFNGADDPFVTAAQKAAFKAEMEQAGVDYQFVDYPGAMHSFTNPGADDYGTRFQLPLAYNPEADAKSWAELREALERRYQD
ncbi:MAG: dienelactone hydrolase family protein [Gammaproteobacteria bacterium]|nr:dienelactone hydrolase family protein [Gammaproteobacteria bacterium]